VDDLIRELARRRILVDRRKIYAVGSSNGGHMALRLAVERSNVFAAVAAIAAAMPADGLPCPPSDPVPVLFMHGTKDPISRWSGGRVAGRGRGETQSVPDSVAWWVRHNRCRAEPEREVLPDRMKGDRSFVERQRFGFGLDDSEVVLYAIHGGGHTEPSRTERYGASIRVLLGNQNGDIEAAEEAWKFFREKKRG
jgi:polyhydroxybutyrate depolymerase